MIIIVPMAGRPAMYETPDEMQDAIDKYFIENEIITITGLALWLGFEDRQSLYDYEKKPEFTCIIKRARLRVENSYEMRLITSQSPTGAIFALKNMGWKDKQETEHSGNAGFTVTLKRANDFPYETK